MSNSPDSVTITDTAATQTAPARGSVPQATTPEQPEPERKQTGHPTHPDPKANSAAASENPSSSGLDGVVVASTRLSHVDGEAGRLVIAGHDIEQAALELTFEQMFELLNEHSRADQLGPARTR